MMAEQRAQYGIWSASADPRLLEVLANAAFDYVAIDLQHGFATAADLPSLIASLRGTPTGVVVRVPWNSPDAIMRALDCGARTVIVPMVNSAAEAAAAVRALRYPPEGERSWGPFPVGTTPPSPEEANASVRALAMVETAAAVDELDAILAVEGLAGVYIGPNDLALSCGFGRQTYRESTELRDLIRRIVDRARSAGLGVGLHCDSAEMAAYWAERGATMLTAGTDFSVLVSALASLRAALLPQWATGAPVRGY
jgi:4-hydroxy-2-oxoheptanedioate aldolase